MKKLIPALIPALILAACTTPAPQLATQSDDTCKGQSYAKLIGQDATALETIYLLGMVRVIRPGDMVTQDFRPERINFIINATGTITAITCG